MPWRARPITPNLIQLTRLRFANAFLVGETTASRSWTRRWATRPTTASRPPPQPAARSGDRPHPGHGDRVGALDALKEKLGDSVEVLMPELDARIHAAHRDDPRGVGPLVTLQEGRLRGGRDLARVPRVLLATPSAPSKDFVTGSRRCRRCASPTARSTTTPPPRAGGQQRAEDRLHDGAA